MKARAAPYFGAVLGLAFLRAGTCHALSLRSSAAEAFLGDSPPGTTVVYSKATGARLRLENSGRDLMRIEVKAASPLRGGLKDGYDPWPYCDRVRLELSRATLGPGEVSDVELAVTVPKEQGLAGGQYQFDALATAYDPAGASLTLKTRVLMSVGPPLAPSPEGFMERPGYGLAPPSASRDVPWEDPGAKTTFKIVNASAEDLTVSLKPARDWDESAKVAEGYEPAPNPRWLRLEPGVVEVRAGAIGFARIGVAIPRQARYAGRRWAFVVAVDAVADGRRTRRYFVLNVRTPDWEEDKRAR